MPDDINQPREYDVVLGGQNLPPIDGVVLGGIEGVRHRLDSVHSQEIRIAALSDTLKYGEEGQALLQQIVLTETGNLQWLAYDLLFNSATENQKQNLLPYIPLQSAVGVDYSSLRNLLASGEWLQANLETSEKIQEAVGKKNQPYFHYLDLIDLSQTDLRTIDQLWVKFSNNHFGYSVQKSILLEKGWIFDEKRNHLSHLYKPNLKDIKNRVFDIYKQFGWIASTFELSQFTFETSPMGSLPMIPGKEIRRRWYYQYPLIIRSDL
ncbi:hypothetical protein BCD64_25655 [Nostoc sp. MBR 210]|nr:hypothetical protein BCD64_25655 [Nostoc sp. MBR 210]